MQKPELIAITETTIRFSEVDSMAVVWHGNYVKYMEDGREAFGSKFGLHYLDVYNNGLMTPIVNIQLDYKKPLNYGDIAVIETKYIDCESAKILFEYRIFRKSDNELIATGSSVQVFLNLDAELILMNPPFIIDWKKKQGLLPE